MPVSFSEFDNSPKEKYLPNGDFKATRTLICAWADRHALLAEMAASGGAAYPYNTDTGARAVGAAIYPFGDWSDEGSSVGLIKYGTAVVAVDYAFSQYEPRLISGKMVVEELNPWLEYRAVDPNWCHVGSAGSNVRPRRAPRVVVAGADYTLSYHEVASAPAVALTLPGYVNVAPFATYRLGVSWPAKCLLYMGPATRDTMRLGTKDKFRVTYQFKFRSIPWSKELTANGWETIYNDVGQELYIPADLSGLQSIT